MCVCVRVHTCACAHAHVTITAILTHLYIPPTYTLEFDVHVYIMVHVGIKMLASMALNFMQELFNKVFLVTDSRACKYQVIDHTVGWPYTNILYM